MGAGARRLRPTADSPPAITIRHLLTMTAGFADRRSVGRSSAGPRPRRLRRVPRAGPDASPGHPGTRFEYSNLGYGILGRVITNVGRRGVPDVVGERLLRPLGMASPRPSTWTRYRRERLALGYVRRDDAWLEEPIDALRRACLDGRRVHVRAGPGPLGRLLRRCIPGPRRRRVWRPAVRGRRGARCSRSSARSRWARSWPAADAAPVARGEWLRLRPVHHRRPAASAGLPGTAAATPGSVRTWAGIPRPRSASWRSGTAGTRR